MNTLNGFTKNEESARKVADAAKGNEFLQIPLKRILLGVVCFRSERFDFDNDKVAIHLAGNVNQEVRLRVVKKLSSHDWVAMFVDLSAKRIWPIGPAGAELVIKLIGVNTFAVLINGVSPLAVSNRQKKVFRLDGCGSGRERFTKLRKVTSQS